MPLSADATTDALTLTASEREAVAAAITHRCEACPMPERVALHALLRRLSAVSASRAGADGEDHPIEIEISDRERGLLADAIDAFMADCNERRGQAGARERSLHRYRAGGVALRL